MHNACEEVSINPDNKLNYQGNNLMEDNEIVTVPEIQSKNNDEKTSSDIEQKETVTDRNNNLDSNIIEINETNEKYKNVNKLVQKKINIDDFFSNKITDYKIVTSEAEIGLKKMNSVSKFENSVKSNYCSFLIPKEHLNNLFNKLAKVKKINREV